MNGLKNNRALERFNFEKQHAALKWRLGLERLRCRIRSLLFRSPANAGSLHLSRSLRAPRGSTFSKLNRAKPGLLVFSSGARAFWYNDLVVIA